MEAKFWMEKENMGGEIVDALVVVLRTRGCRWGWRSGCTMCGYLWDALPNAGGEDVIRQMRNVVGTLSRSRRPGVVKIFTSGSFLDDLEVPPEARSEIFSMLSDAGVERVVVESRPEYVVEGSLEPMHDVGLEVEVALGLESSNDLVRERCINKGFTFAAYKRAAGLLREAGLRVRTYLLLKPPLLTEKEALEDVFSSAGDSAPLSDVISINPMNIQKGTVVEMLWKEGLRTIYSRLPPGVKVVSHPTGGGSRRGVHNCGRCDRAVLDAVRTFSLHGNVEVLDAVLDGREVSCTCLDSWRDQLHADRLLGVPTDVERWRDRLW